MTDTTDCINTDFMSLSSSCPKTRAKIGTSELRLRRIYVTK